jgi:hypothetical protein
MRNKAGTTIGTGLGLTFGFLTIFKDACWGPWATIGKKEGAIILLACAGMGALSGRYAQAATRGIINDVKIDSNNFFHRSSPVGKALEPSKDHSVKP